MSPNCPDCNVLMCPVEDDSGLHCEDCNLTVDEWHHRPEETRFILIRWRHKRRDDDRFLFQISGGSFDEVFRKLKLRAFE